MARSSRELKMHARDEINIVSANAEVDWAAAKRISLLAEGGANITIEGGNITVQRLGKLTIHAGTKHFAGASQQSKRNVCTVQTLIRARGALRSECG